MDTITLLKTRRSVRAELLNEPAPSADQLKDILTIAARVPDHGKLVPFRFIVIAGEARSKLGIKLAEIYESKNPSAIPAKVQQQKSLLTRAPLVVAVVQCPRPSKHPMQEQTLTLGAVCQNLLIAAHAHGFAGQWLTEWFAYDEDAQDALGLDDGETIAAFIHIGTPSEKPEDRGRPDLDAITRVISDVQI